MYFKVQLFYESYHILYVYSLETVIMMGFTRWCGPKVEVFFKHWSVDMIPFIILFFTYVLILLILIAQYNSLM